MTDLDREAKPCVFCDARGDAALDELAAEVTALRTQLEAAHEATDSMHRIWKDHCDKAEAELEEARSQLDAIIKAARAATELRWAYGQPTVLADLAALLPEQASEREDGVPRLVADDTVEP